MRVSKGSRGIYVQQCDEQGRAIGRYEKVFDPRTDEEERWAYANLETIIKVHLGNVKIPDPNEGAR